MFVLLEDTVIVCVFVCLYARMFRSVVYIGSISIGAQQNIHIYH